jgi:Uma2 family endonuclease
MAAPALKRTPLESGDRLTRAEFHHRYEARPDIKRAELVEGVVYVGSPVSSAHGEPHSHVLFWFGAFKSRHPGVRMLDNTTVILDDDNEVQPDAFLWRDEPGGPQFTEEGYLQGSPQLIVEIAVSSASYDLHDKMRAYRRNRVREYIVWRVLDGAIDWFRWEDGEYRKVEPDERGLIESTVFPGLRLDVAKMLAGDLTGIMAALN